MAAQILSDLVARLLDSDGNPVSGGSVSFYLTGTTTLNTVYADSALTVALTNPLYTNAAGLFVNASNQPTAIYLDPQYIYRAVYKDANGTTIRDVDPVNPDTLNAQVAAAQAAQAGAEAAQASAEAAQAVAEGVLDDVAAAGADALTNIAAAAAQTTVGVYAASADGVSKGVIGAVSIVGGSGGTNGTFDIAFSGGAGSGAAGRFTVAGGALTSIVITAHGIGYTSAPTMSFAASTGLTGASATAQIGFNTNDGEYFFVVGSGLTFAKLYKNTAGSAVDTGLALDSTSLRAALYPLNQRNTVEGVYQERFALLDLAAQTYTNLTDAVAPSVTKTLVAGGLQMNLTTASRTYAFSTSSRLNSVSRTSVTYTAALTFASACICGIGVYDGTNRMTVQVTQAGWITYTNTLGGGSTVTTAMGAIASGASVEIRAVFDMDAGTAAFFVSVNGAAPYTFGISSNVFAGNLELIQRGSSTVIHAMDLEGVGAFQRDAMNAFVPSPLTDANTASLGGARNWIDIMRRTPPSGFTHTIPYEWGVFAATFMSPVEYFSNIDLAPVLDEDDPTVAVYYVDVATGSDTAAGTEAAPLKSLKVAGARVLTGGRAIIKAKGGLYPYANAFGGAVGGNALQVVSWDGATVISSRHDDTLVWTLNSGTTWQSAYTNGISAVFDAAHLTSDGDYTQVVSTASLAACQATAGTYFLSGGIIYLNLSDGRQPDSNVRVYKKSSSGTADNYNLRIVAAGQIVYLEDVRFEGGVEPFTVYSAGDAYSATAYAKNCAFKYGAGANNVNWASPGLVVFQDCLAAWSSQDGFNYKPSGFGTAKPLCIEIGCESRWNGWDGAGTNNATTGHGVDIIRVNGLYHHSANRNVHDILSGTTGSISWNLGCVSRNSTSSNNVNFAVGVTGEAAGTIMYLDGCTSSGSTTDLQTNGGGLIYYSNLTSNGVFSGAVATYTP